jgi:integrase
MGLRIARPSRRDGVETLQFLKRIPDDLKERVAGSSLPIPLGEDGIVIKIKPKTKSIRFSLRTRDPREAKARHAVALDCIERWFHGLRTEQPLELTHKQITALAGVFYAGSANSTPDNTLNYLFDPEPVLTPLGAIEEAEMLNAVSLVVAGIRPDDMPAHTDGSLEAKSYDAVVSSLLAQHGVPRVTVASRERLAEALRRLKGEALQQSARYALGDYRPDERLQMFPKWETQTFQPTVAQVSLKGLLESWWSIAKAAGLAENTYLSYRRAINRLGAFMGHDDAARITHNDMLRFKDHRLTTPNPHTGKLLKPKAFRNPELAGLKTIFEWAVTDKRLASNPTDGIVVMVGKDKKLRDKDFTADEVKAILLATSDWRKIDEAFYWVPWLCAYTGARVTEIIQLRKQDITDGVLRITPEAGTVKGKELRVVPIHEHLVALGLETFVKSAKAGYLFVAVPKGQTLTATMANQQRENLRRHIRKVVSDPNVAPNHGWRHTFKTMGRDVDIQEKVLDAICGHSASTEGGKYGRVSLKAKQDAITKFPRYDLGTKKDATQPGPK